MNEQTILFLKELSNKLGTTSEHLFSVLVKQAPITGSINLLLLIFFATCTFLCGRFVFKKTCIAEKDRMYPEWIDGAAFAAWFGFAILVFIDMCFLSEMSTIIASFINPEYWALKQILNGVS